MARTKTYYYLIDNLTAEKAEIMKKALRTSSDIQSITIKSQENLLQVIATRNIEDVVKIACDIAGLQFRMKVKKKFALK